MYRRPACLRILVGPLIAGALHVPPQFALAAGPSETSSAGGVSAQTIPPTKGRQQELAGKLKFIDMLVNRSPRVKRVEASDDSKAKELLAAAQQHHRRAVAEMEKGDLDQVDHFVGLALDAVGIAFRMVADPAHREAVEAERYKELEARVASFRQAFKEVAAQKGAQTAAFLDEVKVATLVGEAEALAKEKRYQQANQPLAKAADMVERALAKAREKETLVYDLNFATPEEEYAYDLERNRSYELLANMMVAQCPPERKSRLPLIKRLIQRNEELRAEADALAAGGDTEGAIQVLQKGTDSLVRALRMAGLPL